MVYWGLVLITIFLQPLLLDIGVQTNSGRTNRQKDEQTEKQTDKRTDRQTTAYIALIDAAMMIIFLFKFVPV